MQLNADSNRQAHIIRIAVLGGGFVMRKGCWSDIQCKLLQDKGSALYLYKCGVRATFSGKQKAIRWMACIAKRPSIAIPEYYS